MFIAPVHRLNILVDKNGNGRIGDFGFSIELPKVIAGRRMWTAKGFARTEGYYGTEVSE